MNTKTILRLALAAFGLVLGGCYSPHYLYKPDDTVYVVQSSGSQGTGEEIARPADHRLELRYVGAAAVDTPHGDRQRILFDALVANESTLELLVEVRGMELVDAAGRAWPSVATDEAGRAGIDRGSERVISLAFEVPEDFEFEQHPRLEVRIPYSIGGSLFLARIRLARERLPDPVYHGPAYYYHPHHPREPWGWHGPRYQFGFGGTFHFH